MTERMSAVDSTWLHLDGPSHPMIVDAVLWLEGPLDRVRLSALVRDRLVANWPRFRQRVTTHLGLPAWEDVAVDLDAHLVFTRLPEPGGQAALEAFVSEQSSRMLPMDVPPWRLFAIEGFGGGWALVARLHHCLADGFALASILLSLADAVAPESPPAHHALVRYEGLARVRLVGQGVMALGKLLLARPDPRTPLKGRLGNRKLVVWSRSWSLDAIKESARARGATVNDLTMAALAGALRRWMETRGGPPRRVRAFVPVDLRPPGQPIPATLGNRFGLVYLPLPSDAPTPDERLARTRAAMQGIKASPEAQVALGIIAVLGRLPTPIEDLAARVLGTKGSLIATNVPGPRQAVTLAGSRVAGIRFWVPQAAQVALGVSVLSYAGEVGIGVMCDAGVVPDPDTLIADFAAEMAAFGVP